MTQPHMDVRKSRSAGIVIPQPRDGSRSTTDGADQWNENPDLSRTGHATGGSGPPSKTPAGAGAAMASDDELLERTLAFSGSYLSDDGNVTVRRVAAASFEYSGPRFLGNCAVCSRAHLIPATGEPLSDVSAAVLFLAAHRHGDGD